MRLVIVVAAVAILSAPASVCGQSVAGRLEYYAAAGVHNILNEMTPSKPGMTGYYCFFLGYNISESGAIGVRYGAAKYKVSYSLAGIPVSEKEAWMGDLFAVYRYSWRQGKPTRIFVEIGGGVCDAIPLYDSGTKGAATAALGVKRFIDKSSFVQVESRGVSFKQLENTTSTKEVTVSINEFTISYGRLF